MAHKITGDNHAAEAAAARRRQEAIEQARREAAERARRDAVEQARRASERTKAANVNNVFAERNGIDASFARGHFSFRFPGGDAAQSPATTRVPTGNPPPSERLASDSVRVNSQDALAGRATNAGKGREYGREARALADALFNRSGRIAEGTFGSNLIENVERDRRGNVTLLERATRDGDRVTYERTEFKNGTATRETYETGAERGSVRRAESWAQPPSADPERPSTDELIGRAQFDRSVSVKERSVRERGGEMLVGERVADQTGTSSTAQTYRTQDHRDGIHGDLDPKFDDGRAIHVVETTAERREWGKPAEKVVTKEYSQGNVRATSIDTWDAGGEGQPRQWSLEIQKGNVYDKQHFVEGNESFKSFVHREAAGPRVTEKFRTEYEGEDGKVEFGGREATTFNDDGTIRSFYRDETDAERARQIQSYSRSEFDTPRGREAEERNYTWKDDGFGVKSSSENRTRTLTTDGGGLQVLESEQTVSGFGNTAVARIDGGGQTLIVNGRRVEGERDAAGLREDVLNLAAASTSANAKNLQGYLGAGKKVFGLLGTGLKPHDLFPGGEGPLAARVNAAAAADPAGRHLLTRLNNGLNARYVKMFERLGVNPEFGMDAVHKVHAAHLAKLGMAAGAAGAVGAGFGLVDGIRGHNFEAVAQNTVALGAASYDMFDTGRTLVNTMRGAATVVPGERAAMLAAKALAPMPGLSSGAKFNATLRVGVLAKYTGGVGNVLGAGLSGFQLYQGIKAGDAATAAKGGVGLAAAVGTGAAIGVWGAGVGAIAGAGLGLAAFGISKGIDAIADKAHDIPEVEI